MDKQQFEKYNSLPQEKFVFASGTDKLHDQKFDTKPVSYLRDAFNRFKRNKASLVAAIIILILVLFAIVGPWCVDQNYVASYSSAKSLERYKELPPRLDIFRGTGFWDGSKTERLTQTQLYRLQGMAIETGYDPVSKIIKEYEVTDGDGKAKQMYEVRVDQYYKLGVYCDTLTAEQYETLQAWQNENNIQVILPWVDETKYREPNDRTPVNKIYSIEPSYWFKCDAQGNPELDAEGKFIDMYATGVQGSDDYNSLRLGKDPGYWQYAFKTGKPGQWNYKIRVSSYNYFVYKYGHGPSFAFGSNSSGYDIFSRLAGGARFSFLLAILVSVINLTIGAIYGAIEGYYGGATDMIMERISDILSGVPFTVVTVLFNLHLAAKVGVVGALIYAFVLTGWIGMASRVRMQFYRFKNQEYVLAARTLGANDWRIIWKHIFPNTLGTIITGTVLVIPGVIFSETSLSYLGIINLDGPTMSSVGSMLSAGQSVMTTAPHVVFFPALFIALLEISFNLFGNGLRDAFNPSLRGSEE